MGYGHQICTASTEFKEESVDHFSSATAADKVKMSKHDFEKNFFEEKTMSYFW